jgi:hypothetical protein
VAIAVIGLRWRSSRKVRPFVLNFIGVSPSHSVSSGWNEAFGREGSPMLRVTLKDGRVVGGYFGDGSLAGYSEHAQDLFISERWSINPENDWFVEAARGTEGLWIARDGIASIEFYERPPDESDGEKKPSD